MGGIGSKPEQLHRYAQEAWRIAQARPKATTWWCEIGFGSGQSTAALLASHPNIKTLTFDLFPDGILTPPAGKMGSWTPAAMHAQQRSAKEFLSSRWPHRAEYIAGDSNHSVSSFARMRPHFKCDLLSVDGWHGSPEVYWDITHLRLLARHGAPLFLDDMERSPLRADVQRAADEGTIAQPHCDASGVGKHEFCTSSYATRAGVRAPRRDR